MKFNKDVRIEEIEENRFALSDDLFSYITDESCSALLSDSITASNQDGVTLYMLPSFINAYKNKKSPEEWIDDLWKKKETKEIIDGLNEDTEDKTQHGDILSTALAIHALGTHNKPITIEKTMELFNCLKIAILTQYLQKIGAIDYILRSSNKWEEFFEDKVTIKVSEAAMEYGRQQGWDKK